MHSFINLTEGKWKRENGKTTIEGIRQKKKPVVCSSLQQEPFFKYKNRNPRSRDIRESVQRRPTNCTCGKNVLNRRKKSIGKK